MASETSICNLALQRLGAQPIVSLTQNAQNAKECARAYDHIRDAEICKYRWNFAIKRVVLAPDSDAPGFDYDYQFTLPTDCIRPLPSNKDTDWLSEGRKILTNAGNTLYLRYLARITDTNLFNPQFNIVLSLAIAKQLNGKVTQSNVKQADLNQEYKDEVSIARAVNAIETISDEPAPDSWETSRL